MSWGDAQACSPMCAKYNALQCYLGLRGRYRFRCHLSGRREVLHVAALKVNVTAFRFYTTRWLERRSSSMYSKFNGRCSLAEPVDACWGLSFNNGCRGICFVRPLVLLSPFTDGLSWFFKRMLES